LLTCVPATEDLEKLTALLQKEVHEMGEVICRQGNIGDNFYIIASGEVSVRKATTVTDTGMVNNQSTTTTTTTEELVAVLKQGDFFGEQALLRDDVRQATCYATTKVITLTLGREDFITLMGTVDDLLASAGSDSDRKDGATSQGGNSPVAGGESKGGHGSVKSNEVDKALNEQQQTVYKLEDFEIGRTLGCGAFGRVKVCKLIQTETYYAIKCQSKMQIVRSKLQTHVVNEVTIMRMLDNNPFIIKLFTTMQDNKYVYFVTELLQGGELFTYLRDTKRLQEQTARFFAASVICAFQALHAKSIAYRDLKPENIVMCANGYVKLIDLGLAKQVLGGKTYTLCGTPDYLAPEVILNEGICILFIHAVSCTIIIPRLVMTGHDVAVDYWALGVLIYEMVIGLPPFYAKDPIEVYEKILTGEVRIHSSLSPNLGDFLKKLLILKQSKRLGTGRGGIQSIMKQKWFSSFDWARLQDLSMVAPYIPVLSGADDVSQFDKFDEVPDPVRG
jgi:serine/threonine protein kinase